MIVQGNVSIADDVTNIIKKVEQILGPIDILVNNAGVAESKDIENITEQDWDKTINTNLKSVFLMTQAVITGMKSKNWGRIINISSTAAQVGGIIGPHYTASKAGILGLTHAYASALVPYHITVNAIAPALIETDMIAGNTKVNPERIPVKRLGKPEEIASVVRMLLTNGYITGQTINVNGGMYFT